VISVTEIDVLIGSSGFPNWRILTQHAGVNEALAVPMNGSVGN
jgi:stress-induced morphogen